MELLAEEIAELNRQNLEAEHFRFHDEIKCGAKLIRDDLDKPHATITRFHCPTHKVYTSKNGWEFGFSLGSKSINYK